MSDKKTRQLTEKEATDLARKEVAHHWYSSPPLFASFQSGEGASNTFPLDEKFKTGRWLIFLIDPSSFMGLASQDYLSELARRYLPHDLNFLGVISPTIPFYLNRSFTEGALSAFDRQIAFVIDHDQSIQNALFQKGMSDVLLVRKSKVHWEIKLADCFKDLDAKIQSFLRETDPGLALLEPYVSTQTFSRSETFWNFKNWSEVNPRISLTGRWEPTQDGLVSQDPHSSLTFSTTFRTLGIVAHAKSSLGLSTKTEVLLKRKNLLHDTPSESERGSFSVQEAALYPIFEDLPLELHTVTLVAPESNLVPLVIQGIRFIAE